MIDGSIVRRGNHFLRMECGWVLIDGPWFRLLDGFDYDTVYIPYIPPLEPLVLTGDYNLPESAMVELQELTWQRVRWHPGYSSHLKRFIAYPYLHSRTKYGFKVYPDGRLPCFFNHVEWIETQWEALDLYRYGY